MFVSRPSVDEEGNSFLAYQYNLESTDNTYPLLLDGNGKPIRTENSSQDLKSKGTANYLTAQVVVPAGITYIPLVVRVTAVTESGEILQTLDYSLIIHHSETSVSDLIVEVENVTMAMVHKSTGDEFRYVEKVPDDERANLKGNMGDMCSRPVHLR